MNLDLSEVILGGLENFLHPPGLMNIQNESQQNKMDPENGQHNENLGY